MTRTVRDAAVLFGVMAGYDPRDPSSIRDPIPDLVSALDRDAKGLRIGWSPDYGYAPVDLEVVAVCRAALDGLGESGCEVTDSDLALDSPFDAFRPLFGTMAFASYGSLLDDDLTDYARDTIEHGATVSGAEYALALGHMDRIRASIEEQLDRFDLVASPTLAVSAFKAGGPLDTVTEIDGREVDPWWGYFPFTFPINMAGLPAVSIPAGFSADGLPIGLQLVGRRGAEETLVTAAAALERARPWAQHRPQVS
jgi:aspartyl-tRNA(Asn)/glutamyl-tRNA(Gln) amidotransferase subunit A